MPISPNDEHLIIRWLFGEIIYHQHQGQPVTHRRSLGWALNTRFQKILFHVAQEQNLPITRSWYMYGGYVHTPMLDQTRFNSNVRSFSRNPQQVLELRRQIRPLELNVDDILAEVEKQTSFFTSMSTRVLLPRYYRTHTPSEHTNLYVTKQVLNDILSDVSKTSTYDIPHFYSLHDTFIENLYNFNEISSEYIENESLDRIKDDFYTLVNTAFDKLEIYAIKELVVDQQILSFFSSVNEFNNGHIWRPYAAGVSQKTITGIRAREESHQMAEREDYSINSGIDEIRSLKFRLERENIEPTFQEYRLLQEKSRFGEDVKQAVGDLFKLYQNSDEEND